MGHCSRELPLQNLLEHWPHVTHPPSLASQMACVHPVAAGAPAGTGVGANGAGVTGGVVWGTSVAGAGVDGGVGVAGGAGVAGAGAPHVCCAHHATPCSDGGTPTSAAARPRVVDTSEQ
eukprot:gene2810-17723_t